MATTIKVFSAPPWDKWKNESDLEYEVFKVFRDTLPMERPEILPELCRAFGLEDWQIKDCAAKFHWLVRAAKYDVWLDAARRQGAIKARFEIGFDLVRMSQLVMRQAEKALEWLSDNDKHPSYREAVEMARLSIELQRAGFSLQGVQGEIREQIDGESPAELIEAAVQVNMIVRRKVKEIEPAYATIDESGASLEPGEMPD